MAADSSDSSDDDLRRALAGFGEQIGADALLQALTELGASGLEHDGVLGDYRLIEELGRGGMGIVFAAEQISVPGRAVAVKLLRGFAGSDKARQRFAREVEVVGRLDHPHIVPILSADTDAATPFFAMKRIDGRSLRDVLQTGELRSDYRAIATMMRDLARALHHAHEHGVVHRDVKPGNVLVDQNAHAMLLDFGLASLVEDESHLTMTTDAVGTPDYMAPEQVRSSYGAISARTDVYALGVTLYECLSGRTPYSAESRHETMSLILRGDAPPVRSLDRKIPRDLANICSMAMQREPNDRYQDAAALADDLDAFLAYQAVRARPPGLARQATLLIGRHRTAFAATALALVAFIGAAIWWGWVLPAQEVATRMKQIRVLQQDHTDLANQIAMVIPTFQTDSLAGRSMNSLRRHHRQAEQQLENAAEAALLVSPDNGELLSIYAKLLAGRLRRLIAGGGILLRPEQIAATTARLKAVDVAGEHHHILDPVGDLIVKCDKGAAEVWLCPAVEREDGQLSYLDRDHTESTALGTTPCELEVPEGSYMLRASLAGFVDINLPLLVRRRFSQATSEGMQSLQFLTSEEIGAGYRQIHRGWGISYNPDNGGNYSDGVGYHRGFLMTEEEVGYEDLVAWQVIHPTKEQQAQLAKATRTLVEDLNWDKLLARLTTLNEAEAANGTNYYTTLPTAKEWQRAGRGADGRRYPWGRFHDWQFSQNLKSSTAADGSLYPTEFPEQDVSPFGIRNMIGSLRELCAPTRVTTELGNKQFFLCGGSYMSTRSEELSLDSRSRLAHNQRVPDAGMRLVRRPLPKTPTGPSSLELDDNAVREWNLTLVRGPLFEHLPRGARSRFDDGKMEVRGFGGSYSPELLCWRGIDTASNSFSLRASWHHGYEKKFGNDRGISFVLGTRPGLSHIDKRLVVSVNIANFTINLLKGQHRDSHDIDVPIGTRFDLTLQGTENEFVATLSWPGGEPLVARIARPEQTVERFHYVALSLPTQTATVATVHELEFDAR